MWFSMILHVLRLFCVVSTMVSQADDGMELQYLGCLLMGMENAKSWLIRFYMYFLLL